MMIFSLVAMIGLEKCCITSAYLQWLCYSGERPMGRGPLVFIFREKEGFDISCESSSVQIIQVSHKNKTKSFRMPSACVVTGALKRQSQQLSSALSSACDFKSHFLQTKEQSDLGPHCLPVCKNRFEKFARIFSRRHKQTTFSDAVFLGALRVKG